MKVISSLLANECNQLCGTAEDAGALHIAWQVTPQGDDTAHSGVLVPFEEFTNALAGALDAGQVRATSVPVSFIVLTTVSMVPERVEPPAPKVTEKNAGSSAARGPRAALRFSSPADVLGGNNSTLKALGCFRWLCMNFSPPRIRPIGYTKCRHS
jgi:hypothetical protein